MPQISQQALRRALRSKGNDDIGACLLALDRNDLEFVLDNLALPAVSKKPAASPQQRKPQRVVTKEEVAVLQDRLKGLETQLAIKEEALQGATRAHQYEMMIQGTSAEEKYVSDVV